MRKLILSFLLILAVYKLQAINSTPAINFPSPIVITKYNYNISEFNIVPIPRDTLPTSAGSNINNNQYQIICFKSFNSSQLSILSNFTEKNIEITIFERVRGIVYTDNITLHAGKTTIIDTPWGKGVYTIIFKLSNGDILRGDFIII